jgi:probable F420-dependent oxidoreductase
VSGLAGLGRIGVFSFAPVFAPVGALAESVRRIEELGYGAVWFPETPAGREAFTTAGLLLGWSEKMVIATGIASIYARDATATANGARGLAEAYPGRFLLGLGVSHAPSVAQRGGTYGPPVATMRAYLDAIDATEPAFVADGDETPERVLAALGPLMLKLAGERTAGAHPYFVPVEHTAYARARLGPDAFLAPEQAVLLEPDPARARAIAREHTAGYLRAENYRASVCRFGFEEADLENGGSDRLVDAIVAWGDQDAIRARVRAHLDAGADHVCIQALGSPRETFGLDALAQLAPALLNL